MRIRINARPFSDLNGRYGAHQVSFYEAPASGSFYTTPAARFGHFLHGLFHKDRKIAWSYPTTTKQRRNYSV